jgi:hypothetical protein
MRYITFLLYTAVMALITILLGCSTENPLCSDNYCVSGEIFLRSQLLEGEDFSEVNVAESNLIAAFANATPATPVETAPVVSSALSDIVTDVVAGNTTYLNQTVTVTGYVVLKGVGGAMAIHTGPSLAGAIAQGAVLWIESFDAPEVLNQYALNTQYEFTITIILIREPKGDTTWRSIWAVLAE